MKNPVVFWELACHDAEKSIAFFEKIFDWTFEQYPDSILYGAETSRDGKGVDGGIFTLRKARLPFMAIYVQVEDIHEKAKLVVEAGGMIVEEPQQIPSGSWICLFTGPSGVTFAMLESAKSGE